MRNQLNFAFDVKIHLKNELDEYMSLCVEDVHNLLSGKKMISPLKDIMNTMQILCVKTKNLHQKFCTLEFSITQFMLEVVESFLKKLLMQNLLRFKIKNC